MSERAEQLQTAVAQSVSVQEGLKGLLTWLDNLHLKPGPVEATAHAVQDAMTQNQVGCCQMRVNRLLNPKMFHSALQRFHVVCQ